MGMPPNKPEAPTALPADQQQADQPSFDPVKDYLDALHQENRVLRQELLTRAATPPQQPTPQQPPAPPEPEPSFEEDPQKYVDNLFEKRVEPIRRQVIERDAFREAQFAAMRHPDFKQLEPFIAQAVIRTPPDRLADPRQWDDIVLWARGAASTYGPPQGSAPAAPAPQQPTAPRTYWPNAAQAPAPVAPAPVAGPGGGPAGSSEAPQLSEMEREAASRFGMSPEDWVKWRDRPNG